MRAAVAGEAFDGRHRMTFGAERRDQAAVHRLAVEQHGAGAAISGVAAFLDAEMAEVAQERTQALPGARLFGKARAVYPDAHGGPDNSARMSSASRKVMCLRHSGLPWTSSW